MDENWNRLEQSMDTMAAGEAADAELMRRIRDGVAAINHVVWQHEVENPIDAVLLEKLLIARQGR